MTRFSFFLLLCGLFPAKYMGVALAQSPMTPTPATRALLPPAREAQGVGVQVVGAGFGFGHEVYGDDSGSYPLFFVDYRVTPPNPKTTGGIEHPWAVLKRLRAPNGQMFFVGDNRRVGETWRAHSVHINPAWKSVTAIFETIVPGAPAGISGKFGARYALAGALPTRENPVTTPNTQIVTPQGTTVTLTSIEADYEKHETVYSLDISRPPTAAFARTPIDSLTTEITDDQNRVISTRGNNGSFSTRRGPQQRLIFKSLPPADSVTATVKFDLAETFLRQRQFYKTLELEVPVAALFAFDAQRLKAQAPDAERMVNKIYRAQNAEFSARIERYGSRDNLHGSVYVAPVIAANVNTAAAARTIAEPVMLRLRDAAGQITEENLQPQLLAFYFHNYENTPTAMGEGFASISVDTPVVDAQTTVSLDVQSRQRIACYIDLRDVEIEKQPTKILPPTANNHGLWLQKVSRISYETMVAIERTGRQDIQVPGGCLVLEGVYEPFAPDTELKIDGHAINAMDDHARVLWSSDDEAVLKTVGGSAVKENPKDKTWMVVLFPFQPEDPDATRVDIGLSFTEIGPVQARATLEFPGVNWSSAMAPVK